MSYTFLNPDRIMAIFLRIILLFILIFAPGCDQRKAKTEPSGKVIRIGVIAPLSGPDKTSGDSALLGIRTALQMQPYIKNGDKVELVVEDNEGTSHKTLTSLEKLREQEDVAGVLLMAKSDIVLQLVYVADEYGIPIFALIATHPDITKNNRFITQLGFDDVHQGTVAALYVRDEMLIDRVAVVSDPDNAHYTFLANAFSKEFSSAGGELVEHVLYGLEKSNLKDILKQLQNKNVQLLYLAVSPDQVVEIARETEEMGWKPRLMGSDGLMSNILLQYKDDITLVNGMMATDFYSSILPKTEYGKNAVRIFKKLFTETQTSYTGLGCEGASLLMNAMDRCGKEIHRPCVNLMLRNTDSFEGIFGKITIQENGKTERPVIMNVIEGQKMTFLVKVY